MNTTIQVFLRLIRLLWRAIEPFRIRRSGQRFVSLLSVSLSFSIGFSLLATQLISCSSPGVSQNAVELTIVSNAVTRTAYEGIMPLFADYWQKQHNQQVLFSQSYGASGSQTRAVIDGLPADVVDLALALDVHKIEQAGLIQPGWEQRLPHAAIAHKSVVALVTREGNPKSVSSWADLAKDDVAVLTANPKTSGGARWNFLGLWGSVAQTGGDDATSLDFVARVFQNTPVLPRDAREATDIFYNQEQGDVLLNYENELILAGLNGETLSYIVPDVNISIDNPVAVVDANVDKHGNRDVAEAFVQFLFTPEAQREFAKAGFRPVDEAIATEFRTQYPPVANLFTVQDLGGWDVVQPKFFADGAIFDQILTRIAR